MEQDLEKCLSYLYGLIEHYAKTEKGYRDKLQQKGFTSVAIKYAMETAKEKHFINDAAFAESYIASNMYKKGAIRIRNELIVKGVKGDIIDELLNDIENQTDTAYRLAEKFLNNKEITQDTMSRLYRHLAQKGFSYEEITTVLREIKDSEGY